MRTVLIRMRREYHFVKAVVDDPDTPRISRWLIGAGIAYLVSPIDLVPDVIPILGQLDDVLVAPILIWLAMIFVPRRVKRAARRRTRPIEVTHAESGSSVCFEVEPIRGPYGVRITAMRTGALTDHELMASLLGVVYEHRVVVLDPSISEPLLDPSGELGDSGRAGAADPPVEGGFPKDLSILEGVEYPTEKRVLRFLDLAAAYDALTEEDKAALEAVRFKPRNGHPARPGAGAGARRARSTIEPRPFVVEHPVTRRKSLVPIDDDAELVGDAPVEATRLIESLHSHQNASRFSCTHEQGYGDVVLWDATTSLESRAADPTPERGRDFAGLRRIPFDELADPARELV